MSEEYAARIMPAFPQGARYARIIWPFYYWQALVPERVTADMPDVFEQLYAALEKLDPKVDAKDVFRQLGIDDELYRAVETNCHENGIDSETAKWRKTEIYLFRDAVTGALIPELTLRSLPREQKIRMGNEDLQSLSPCTNLDCCPDALELEQLLREFRYNHAFLQENPEDVDFDDPSVIETLNAWDDDEESETSDDVDFFDSGFSGMTQLDGDLPSALQIHDRYAGKIKMQLYLYIDPNHPEDMHIATPFPNVPRLFFDRILENQQAEELQETIQFAREMMEDHPKADDTESQLADEYFSDDDNRDADASQEENDSPLEEIPPETEENLAGDMPENEEPVAAEPETLPQATSGIKLIEVHSSLFSQPSYHLFRKAIEELAYDYDAIVVRHERMDTQFYTDCGKLLEAVTRYSMLNIDQNERKESAKRIQYSAFEAQVSDILQQLGQTNCDKIGHINAKNVSLALRGKNNREGSAKELMIGMAIDAIAQERESRKAFQTHPSLVQELFAIYNQRNENAHFNEKVTIEQKERERIVADVYERITQLSDVLIRAYLHPHISDK